MNTTAAVGLKLQTNSSADQIANSPLSFDSMQLAVKQIHNSIKQFAHHPLLKVTLVEKRKFPFNISVIFNLDKNLSPPSLISLLLHELENLCGRNQLYYSPHATAKGEITLTLADKNFSAKYIKLLKVLDEAKNLFSPESITKHRGYIENRKMIAQKSHDFNWATHAKTATNPQGIFIYSHIIETISGAYINFHHADTDIQKKLISLVTEYGYQISAAGNRRAEFYISAKDNFAEAMTKLDGLINKINDFMDNKNLSNLVEPTFNRLSIK